MNAAGGKRLIIQYYVRALPQLTGAAQVLPAKEHIKEIATAAVSADWGDEIMNPPWNGNWQIDGCFEDGTNDEDMQLFEFRDENGRIADEEKYREMCNDIRVFWKMHLTESYPGIPEKQLDAALDGAQFRYSPKYASVTASFPHTGLDEYIAPRKPTLLEKLFSEKKGMYDKTVCLFIMPYANLNARRDLYDRFVQREIIDTAWQQAVINHYRRQLRPPVKSNCHYTVVPSPVMNEEMKAVAQFWDEETRQIKYKDRYKNLCDQMRPLMRKWMNEEFPDYDAEKLEDGLENIRFDYCAEQGTITASIILEQLMSMTEK